MRKFKEQFINSFHFLKIQEKKISKGYYFPIQNKGGYTPIDKDINKQHKRDIQKKSRNVQIEIEHNREID